MLGNKILEKAIETYGVEAQIRTAFEEMAELTQAICKSLRGVDNLNNVVEEISDVEIMLEQIKMIYEIEQWEVDIQKKAKLIRLAERLNMSLSDEDKGESNDD